MRADGKLPLPEEIKALDAMTAEYDRELAEREGPDLATRSYAVTVDEWLRFTAFIALLDAAVRAPLANDSGAMLLTARGLIDDTPFALAAALTHAGEAILHHRMKGG